MMQVPVSDTTDFCSPKLDSVVGYTSVVVCILSVMGSLLIILSYILVKSIRSKVRLLLVHLSIMDFGVGCCNLFGIAYNYRRGFVNISESDSTEYALVGTAAYVCVTQAFFAGFCTYGSIIWTVLFSAYLYLLTAHQKSLLTKYTFVFFYLFGYGIPLIPTLWLLLTNRFGYDDSDSAGWCITLVTTDKAQLKYINAIGYDLFIYLAFILISAFCLAVYLMIMQKSRMLGNAGLGKHAANMWSQVYYKFLTIPAVFVVLRVWTCIVNVLRVYYPVYLPCGMEVFLSLLAGIGDSGQGMVNGVLFVLLTKPIRHKIWQKVKYWCQKSKDNIQGSTGAISDQTNEEDL